MPVEAAVRLAGHGLAIERHTEEVRNPPGLLERVRQHVVITDRAQSDPWYLAYQRQHLLLMSRQGSNKGLAFERRSPAMPANHRYLGGSHLRQRAFHVQQGVFVPWRQRPQ